MVCENRLPAVDTVVTSLDNGHMPRPLLVGRVREALERARASGAGPSEVEVLAAGLVSELIGTRPQRVINASGVLLHTNLGRAPWSDGAANDAITAGTGYGNVELDLVSGVRGRRGGYVSELLTTLTGAEAALVVNNNAGAVFLILAVLGGDEVPVSRGELVEIGGSYRLPDLMVAAGVRLVEVGTTNRTRLVDYQKAVEESTGLLLKVHRSNFRIVGFTEEALLEDLAGLAQRVGVPLVFDAGSGLLDETTPWLDEHPPGWLVGEPGVRQALEHGADLVCFSGDKLLGGPQAGIIVGRGDLVDKLRVSPIARALRPDGVTLAGLAATLEAYADRRVLDLPLWRMATTPNPVLQARTERLLAEAKVDGRIVEGGSAPGAGSAPGWEIPTPLIELDGDADAIFSGLLGWRIPILARRVEGRVRLDLRAVDVSDEPTLVEALGVVCRS